MTLSPTDLLDEDGNVDTAAVRARANADTSHHRTVDAETCARWRREAIGAPSAQAVAEETRHADDTIRRHISGECSCAHGVAPLVYERSHSSGQTGSRGRWRAGDE